MHTRKRITSTLIYFLLVFAFVLFTFPFFLLIVNSFKNNGQIIENPFSFPTSFHFNQIIEAFHKMDFLVSFKNTFMISSISVLLILIFSAMTGYYIVRTNTKFNRMFFMLLVTSMIIPFQSLMIPLMYIYGSKLHFIDAAPIALLIMLYVGFGSAFSVFIYHGFIKSIPLELEEASFIDGCTSWQTFYKIVLPMISPISATIAILNTLWIWNDYLLPSLVLTTQNNYTMPIQMKVFNGTYMNNWELLIPAILMVIAPILIVYLFAQRFVISGITQGAIK